jgi:pimeloyl-ACP methyl ester carboxylesterase
MSRGVPFIVETARGVVEISLHGDGAPVLTLHGAMGGYDQSELLAETVGPDASATSTCRAPGYLGTPLASGVSPRRRRICTRRCSTRSTSRIVAVMGIFGGGPSAAQFAARHSGRCRALLLFSTCGTRVDTPIPWSFHIMTALARWPFAVRLFRDRALGDHEASVRRSILDPEARARALADPDVVRLMRALTASTFDRMAQRLPGTANDIRVTRRLSLPLESITVPTLVVDGTADRMVPFDLHATAARRVGFPGAECLALERVEHVAIFTHRAEVCAHVAAFLAVSEA